MRTFTSLLTLVLMFSFAASPALAAKDGFARGKSQAQLQDKYADEEIRILIAAGHEPGYGGAVYQGAYEREIVVDVAEELENLLDQHDNYEIIITRDDTAWHPSLQKYFDKNEKKITKFVNTQKKKMAKLLKKGTVGDSHDHGVAAPTDVALRLYGINKWVNENKIDLVVNLHVNDAPDHGPNAPSKYTGYAVYVPDAVYGNSATAKKLGEAIADRLDALSNVSTLPQESAGVVPHREFIAVGANGTLNVPSVLIEYGYITEPRFTLPEHRETLVKDLAYQTYLALQGFFDDPVEDPREVTKLPTTWPMPEPVATSTPVVATTSTPVVMPPVVATTTVTVTQTTTEPAVTASSSPVTPATQPNVCTAFTKPLSLMKDSDSATEEVKRLQQILAKDKTLYPEGLVTGFFGPATERAVQRFQAREKIVMSGTASTTGYGAVGPKTAQALLVLCAK